MKWKIISLILVAILVANLLLFAFRKINDLVFWIIIIVIALLAYKVIPMIKEREKK